MQKKSGTSRAYSFELSYVRGNSSALRVFWILMMLVPRAWGESTISEHCCGSSVEPCSFEAFMASPYPALLILLLMASPYLLWPRWICGKIHRLLPDLSKKELRGPVYRGFFLGFSLWILGWFVFSFLEEFFQISFVSLPITMAYFFVIPYITVLCATRWTVSRAFGRGNWESRGITPDAMKHSILKGMNSCLIKQYVGILAFFMGGIFFTYIISQCMPHCFQILFDFVFMFLFPLMEYFT